MNILEHPSINSIQDEIIEEFSDFDDWMDRYQLLIDLGADQEPLDECYKIEKNLIDGCQSRVWLQADMREGLLHFQAESDHLEKLFQQSHSFLDFEIVHDVLQDYCTIPKLGCQ